MNDRKPNLISNDLASDNEEISIWFDSYDDIFSDFDPRPYSKRTLSDDFIIQLKKVVKDTDSSNLTLKLLMLETNRNDNDEKLIIDKLHFYFANNFSQLSRKKKETNRKGIFLTLIGAIFMIIASYISFLQPETYYIHTFLILFEPFGWFLLWMGFDALIYGTRQIKKELKFFKKMLNITIEFGIY